MVEYTTYGGHKINTGHQTQLLPGEPARVGVFRYTIYPDKVRWMAEIITHTERGTRLESVGGGHAATMSDARQAADRVLV